jgi:hypothetical protein
LLSRRATKTVASTPAIPALRTSRRESSSSTSSPPYQTKDGRKSAEIGEDWRSERLTRIDAVSDCSPPSRAGSRAYT